MWTFPSRILFGHEDLISSPANLRIRKATGCDELKPKILGKSKKIVSFIASTITECVDWNIILKIKLPTIRNMVWEKRILGWKMTFSDERKIRRDRNWWVTSLALNYDFSTLNNILQPSTSLEQTFFGTKL